MSVYLPRSTTGACLLLAGAFLLVACGPAVVGGAAVAVHDRRSMGTVLDDQTIEYRVIDAIYSSDEIGEESHIKVEAYAGVVLLMGETDTEARKELAGRLASGVPYVERVVNEVAVEPIASGTEKFANTWLTTKVNSALTRENVIEGFDATRIKVVSSRKTVYLMGMVTREEGDAVANVARNVSGVGKVVKVFNYLD